MQRYYFMVQFLPKEANLALLTGRCISIMHGFICKHDIQGVGVSFPAWSESSIGNVIAFVYSDPAVLSDLRLQSYFQDMLECGFFKIGSVEPASSDCAEVRFKRNQSIAKMFVGETRRRLKRSKKRAIERGEAFNPRLNNCGVRRAIHLAQPTTIYCGYRFLIDWYVIGLEHTACSSNL